MPSTPSVAYRGRVVAAAHASAKSRLLMMCISLAIAGSYAQIASSEEKKQKNERPGNAAKLSEPATASNAELLRLIEAERSKYSPVTAETLRLSREELAQAVTQLDRFLTGPGSDGWRSFLKWPLLVAQAQRAGEPNLEALGTLRARFASGYPGLEQAPLADVRGALNKHIDRIESVGSSEEVFRERLKAIEVAIKKPSPESLRAASDAVAGLDRAGQAPALLAALHNRMSYPNVTLHASDRFVWTGVARSVDETAPLSDYILGTRISGTGRTLGHVAAALVPDAEQAKIETTIRGVNYANTVGHKGPALVYSAGQAELWATKVLLVTSEGLASQPADAGVSMQSRITGYGSTKHGVVDRIVKKAAAKRAPQAAANGLRIGQQHAQRKFRDQVDAQAVTMIARANDRFFTKVRSPLSRLDAFPRTLRFSTTSDYLNVVGLQPGPAQLGALTPVPEAQQPADVLVRMHESLVNNAAETLLASRLLDQADIDRFSLELAGQVPDRSSDPERHEPWSVTFDDQHPVSLTIDDQIATLTVRGSRFTSGTRKFDGMRISVRYVLSNDGGEIRATRQGDVEVVPLNFVAGRSRPLSAREAAVLGPIRKRFAKLFEPEFVSPGLRLKGNWERLGPIPATEFRADDGWLLIGWTQPSEATNRAAATVTAAVEPSEPATVLAAGDAAP